MKSSKSKKNWLISLKEHNLECNLCKNKIKENINNSIKTKKEQKRKMKNIKHILPKKKNICMIF